MAEGKVRRGAGAYAALLSSVDGRGMMQRWVRRAYTVAVRRCVMTRGSMCVCEHRGGFGRSRLSGAGSGRNRQESGCVCARAGWSGVRIANVQSVCRKRVD